VSVKFSVNDLYCPKCKENTDHKIFFEQGEAVCRECAFVHMHECPTPDYFWTILEVICKTCLQALRQNNAETVAYCYDGPCAKQWSNSRCCFCGSADIKFEHDNTVWCRPCQKQMTYLTRSAC